MQAADPTPHRCRLGQHARLVLGLDAQHGRVVWLTCVRRP
jgi:hypothetical protein